MPWYSVILLFSQNPVISFHSLLVCVWHVLPQKVLCYMHFYCVDVGESSCKSCEKWNLNYFFEVTWKFIFNCDITLTLRLTLCFWKIINLTKRYYSVFFSMLLLLFLLTSSNKGKYIFFYLSLWYYSLKQVTVWPEGAMVPPISCGKISFPASIVPFSSTDLNLYLVAKNFRSLE